MTRRIPTAIGAISLLICNYSAATPPNYGDGACLDASTCVSVGAKDVKNVGVDVFGVPLFRVSLPRVFAVCVCVAG